MIKSFKLKDEGKINDYLSELDKGLGRSVTIVGNAELGSIIVQSDDGTEKASILRSLINAHAQFFNDILTDNNKMRFAMEQEIMINGEIGKKNGGSARRDELENALVQARTQMAEFRQKISVNTWHMKAIADNVKDIKAGKHDEQFL